MTAAPERFRLADASIRIDTMPAAGRDLRLSLGGEEREAVAAHLGVTSVERLDVSLNAVRLRGGIRVTGRLDAIIIQPSVVSLEPVRQEISEAVDRVFFPGAEKPYAGPADAEIFVDLEGEDLPDHFDGPEADLSDLILETLALAIEPYPRLPGEVLETPSGGDDPEADSPFASLRVLRDRAGKG